jgi:hypothetical protein
LRLTFSQRDSRVSPSPHLKTKTDPFSKTFCLKIRIYKTIILPVVLYGCKTWSLTLREEHRLRVFENRALRRIFGPKRDEVTGENGIMRSFVSCTLRQV